MFRSLKPLAAWSTRIACVLLVSSLLPASLAFAHGFALMPPMAHAREDHAMTPIGFGEALVAGGYEGTPVVPLASAEIFDPFQNAWRPAASMTRARVLFRLTLLPDGRALATGGQSPSATATTEIYDPVLDTWTPAAPMSTARLQHTATLLSSGDVLVCGGFQTSTLLSSCERFDPASGTWHAAASMLRADGNKIATLLPSGQVLMVNNLNALVEIYDPVADTWTQAASMPEARESYTAALLPSGRLLVIGGRVGAPISNTAIIYDPASNTWTPTATMAARRAGGVAIALPNGDILAAGGNTTPPDAEIFDVATETWRPAGEMLVDRGLPTASLVDPGDALIAGGLDPTHGTPLAITERYVAGAETFLDVTTTPDPSQVGEPYTVTVAASAPVGTPTGTVVVSDPFGATCGPVPLVDGVATCELVAMSDGPHWLTAAYTPDSVYFEASTGEAPHDVVEADTHLAIVSHDPEPSVAGQPITITVDFGVTPPGTGTPHGSIFVDDGSELCFIDEGETSCVLTPSVPGPLTITASYGGDGDFNPSSDSVVHHVNQLPLADGDLYAALEDVPLTIDAANGVLANDTDPDGDSLFVVTVGSVPVDGIGGVVDLAADGSFTFEPVPDSNGEATFVYAVSDGLEESFATVTIAVGAVNDPPDLALAADPAFPAGGARTETIAEFATVTSFGPPDESGQSVLAWPVRTVVDADGVLAGTPSIALDGTLTVPLSGHGGAALIGVTLEDDGGTENGGQDTSAERTFTITVAPGADLSVSIDDGTGFAIGGDPLLYAIVVRNAGPDAADGAHVQETLSSNLVDVTWTCTASNGASCAPSGSGAIDDRASLPAGATATYTLTATVVADPEASVSNDVRVIAPESVTDFNAANNEASDWDVTGLFADGFESAPTR